LKRISAFIERIFREREVILRSETGVRYLVLSPAVQKTLAAVAFLGLGVLIWTVVAREEAWRLVDAKRQEVARAESAYRAAIDNLGTAVDTAQEKGRAESAAAMLNLVEQNEALQQHLKDVSDRLTTAEGERARAAAEHEALVARMRKLDEQVRAIASRHSEFSSLMSTLSSGLDDAMAERGRLAVEADRLAADRSAVNAEMAELGRQQSLMQANHDATIDQLTKRTQAGIDMLKRLISRTGLDPDKVLPSNADPGGMGGPFVPVPGAEDKARAKLVGLGTQIGQLAQMRKLLHSLPVGAPLENYNLMSPFGVRRDPLTGQLAMHNGLDLAGSYHEPVMATAPGVVKIAGWSGEYGNMVEIDHGYGLVTRYAHLSRVQVKTGQKVALHQVVGIMGTTGRSTGPHVHYEVLSDGKNLNSAKFLEAARDVPKQ
jgi:murein DD-endopeptidase MepM/ murein hydrolase activator NlpD